jgi:hypothetical protein
MACPDCGSPAGDFRFATSSRLTAWIAGRTKHSTKNSLSVASAAGDMTSASGMARKSCSEISIPSGRHRDSRRFGRTDVPGRLTS